MTALIFQQFSRLIPNGLTSGTMPRKDAITVNLYGRTVDKKRRGELVARDPYFCEKGSITAEDLLEEVAGHLGISSIALPLFGLRNRLGWLLPSTKICKGDKVHFSWMLPLADKARLRSLMRSCDSALTYIYEQLHHQCEHKELRLDRISDEKDFADIFLTDILCYGYTLGLTTKELKSKISGDMFSILGNRLKKATTISALQEHYRDKIPCVYKSIMLEEDRQREIATCHYRYITSLLELVHMNGAEEFRDVNQESLYVVSHAAGLQQGLHIVSRDDKNSCVVIPVSNICKVNVDKLNLVVKCLDTMKDKVFSFESEERAQSLALLLNSLYKLSLNCTVDICRTAARSVDKILQDNGCHPPSRKAWVEKRILDAMKMNPDARYLLCEDPSKLRTLKLCVYLGSHSEQFEVYDIVRNSCEDKWYFSHDVENPFPLSELKQRTIQHLQDQHIVPVPLLLPLDDIVYHCQPVNEEHIPAIVSNCTLTHSIADGIFTSTYIGDALLSSKTDKRARRHRVCIKKLNADEHYRAFTDMANSMLHWKHPHIVCLLGISLKNGIEIILEYCNKGDLRRFLNHSLDNYVVKKRHLVRMCEQLLQALVYLQSLTSRTEELGKISGYHGNINASNIMVMEINENDIDVKLGDPGLVSAYKTMPLKHPSNRQRLGWMAPEVLPDHSNLTTYSDVYALGVLLWEIWTVGLLPYKEILNRPDVTDSAKDRLIIGYVKDGGQLVKPELADAQVYGMMQACWQHDALARPSPLSLLQQLRLWISTASEEDLDSKCCRDDTTATMDNARVQWELVKSDGRATEVADNLENEQQAAGMNALKNRSHLSNNSSERGAESIVRNRPKQISSFDITIFRNQKKLGKGAFGVVEKAMLYKSSTGNRVYVAVKKCLSGNEDPTMLKNEISLMSNLEHENIVMIEGYCLHQGVTYMVMEYMDEGCLREFVINHKNNLSYSFMKTAAIHVARGMEYLVSQKVLHRDLAARNILLSNDKDASTYTAKISDFGLSRILVENEYQMSQAKLPWRWYAPEALNERRFSFQSDCWSYGCVVWEIFDKCENKLQLDEKKDEHINKLQNGERKAKPRDCPQKVYDMIILRCWKQDSGLRPTFTQILTLWNDPALQDPH